MDSCPLASVSALWNLFTRRSQFVCVHGAVGIGVVGGEECGGIDRFSALALALRHMLIDFLLRHFAVCVRIETENRLRPPDPHLISLIGAVGVGVDALEHHLDAIAALVPAGCRVLSVEVCAKAAPANPRPTPPIAATASGFSKCELT